jgi:tetratricopeptide (TPR) repeat protein
VTRTLFTCALFLLLLPVRTIADDTKSAEEAVKRGFENLQRNDLGQAIKDFNEAIRLDPKNAKAFRGRGSAWGFALEYDKTIDDYTEAIRLDSTNSWNYLVRGLVYEKKEEHDKAIEDFNKAIQLDPKNAEAFHNRGMTFAVKRENEKAIKDFTEAIRLKPNHAGAIGCRGGVHLAEKQFDKAIEDCTEAIRSDPNSAGPFRIRSVAYAAKKEYDKAIQDRTEVVRLDPKDSVNCALLAWYLATCPQDKLRDGKKAVELATTICELSKWNNQASLGILAAAYAECGDFKEAVKWQKKANELGFDDKEEAEKARQRLKLFEEGKPYREK